MTFEEFRNSIKNAKTGDKISFDWADHSRPSQFKRNCIGRIYIDAKNIRYYVCSNDVGDGVSSPNKFEYKNSWRVSFGEEAEDFENLKLINQTNTPIMSNLTDRVKALVKTDPEKSLYKSGITDVDDNLTEDGQAILNNLLFEGQKTKLAEIAKSLIKENKETK